MYTCRDQERLEVIPEGGSSRKIGWGCAGRLKRPYPIKHQNQSASFITYLLPDQEIDTLFKTRQLKAIPCFRPDVKDILKGFC